jgi:hypothetical protein
MHQCLKKEWLRLRLQAFLRSGRQGYIWERERERESIAEQEKLSARRSSSPLRVLALLEAAAAAASAAAAAAGGGGGVALLLQQPMPVLLALGRTVRRALQQLLQQPMHT